MLWGFPDFEIAPRDGSSDTIRASDARLPPASLGRGQGRFAPYLSSVRIPTPSKYCEALILLLCQDYGNTYETYWLAILTYILEFVDGMDFLGKEDLGEDYRRFYDALKHGDSIMYLLLEELRCDLMEKQLLPLKQD